MGIPQSKSDTTNNNVVSQAATIDSKSVVVLVEHQTTLIFIGIGIMVVAILCYLLRRCKSGTSSWVRRQVARTSGRRYPRPGLTGSAEAGMPTNVAAPQQSSIPV